MGYSNATQKCLQCNTPALEESLSNAPAGANSVRPGSWYEVRVVTPSLDRASQLNKL